MFEFNRILLATLLVASSLAQAGDAIWQEVDAPQTPAAFPVLQGLQSVQARGAPSTARQYRVDNLALRASLERVTEVIGPGSQRTISLPMADGSLGEFEIYESSIMEDELAQKYPGIRTFKVYGIDDPHATGRLDITPAGFHAMLYTSQGRLFIDPQTVSSEPHLYQARSRSSQHAQGYSCRIDELDLPAHSPLENVAARTAARSSNKLFKYKLAVSATPQYVNKVGGTRGLAQAEIVTAINRVNEIYERDLGIFLKLVNDNDKLIDVNGVAGFSNNVSPEMFEQNQTWIDSRLGNSKYDLGHVFTTGAGGLGWLGSVCDDAVKASGVSGIANPIGDPFYIDFVSHELGHQFNADHTFNGSTQSCGPSRNSSTAYEPGSGTSIMAYAGICGDEDLQNNSDATFHAGSIQQINKFIAGAGSCYKRIDATPANPSHPEITALEDKAIPVETPFVLEAEASDADADLLSYQWDQMDTGCKTDSSTLGRDLGSNPLFRSYAPRDDEPARHFPSLGTQLQGLYDDAEVLPCHERDLKFRVTARDGRSGQDTRNMQVAVEKSGGQFRITRLDSIAGNLNNPGKTIVNPAPIDVQWRVAKTDKAPVKCANVDIDLMTFTAGYATYSIHPLLALTPNDGAEPVSIVPVTESHPRARIRVKCSDNIFYDISDADFAITGTGAGTFTDNDMVVFFNDGTTGNKAPKCQKKVSCKKSGEDSGLFEGSGKGSSALDYRWLLLLGGLLLLARLRRRSRLRACSAA